MSRFSATIRVLLIKSRAVEALLAHGAMQHVGPGGGDFGIRRWPLKSTRSAVENIARRRINTASVRANNKIVKVARSSKEKAGPRLLSSSR